MRFLVDECTGPRVADWLRDEGHEAFSVFDQAKGISDEAVLAKANSEDWILITNDKDFGEMIFRERRPHQGVIFLRLEDERASSKIDVLRKLLQNHSEKLPGKFVTVSETKVRFART
jgi:predicted nuclease of predicted toxin-antitoxin system